MSSTLATQSRKASFIASFSVPAPDLTGRTSAPGNFIREDVRRLPLYVGNAHVHFALQAEARRQWPSRRRAAPRRSPR